jgi:hypothetical protein
VRTVTSHFDPVWNSFSKHTDGSMLWIPKQIVAIGEDFHSHVGDGKVRTTLYKVRWEGYDKKDDTWETITYLQGYATMVKSFKESHSKDLEKLAADRQRESEKKSRDDLLDDPKHTVLSMTGLTSAVWTLGMFQMVTGESCQCIRRTKQKEPCHVGVRHAAFTVSKCSCFCAGARRSSCICALLDPRFKDYNWPTRKYVQNAPVMHSVYIVL